MTDMPTIESVMVKSPISIDIAESVRVAQDKMIDHEIRHLPVLEGDSLVGVLSDRDVAVLETDPDWEQRAEELTVRDLCSLDFYAVERDAALDDVLMEMAGRRIGSVIVTEKGEIAGLFTAVDACRCFAEHLRDRDE